MIHGVTDQSSFKSADCYKSVSNQKSPNIPAKTVKRVAQRRKVKKVENSRTLRKLSLKT